MCVILTQGHTNLLCITPSLVCVLRKRAPDFSGVLSLLSSVLLQVLRNCLSIFGRWLCLLHSWSQQAVPGSPPCTLDILWSVSWAIMGIICFLSPRDPCTSCLICPVLKIFEIFGQFCPTPIPTPRGSCGRWGGGG